VCLRDLDNPSFIWRFAFCHILSQLYQTLAQIIFSGPWQKVCAFWQYL
jgi:hypothetical protein